MELPYGHGQLWYMHAPFVANTSPLFGYQSPLPPRETFRQGIALTEAYCQQKWHKKFAELTAEKSANSNTMF